MHLVTRLLSGACPSGLLASPEDTEAVYLKDHGVHISHYGFLGNLYYQYYIFFIIFMCMNVCLHVCKCTPCRAKPAEIRRECQILLELELQMVISCHVDAGN